MSNLENAIAFYVDVLGAEVRIRSEVPGSSNVLLVLGGTRVILFDKAPYEDRLGKTLPLGSCTMSTKSMTSTPRSRGCVRRG